MKAENDQLRQQLAAAKNEQMKDFRKLYEEMNKADAAKDKNKNKNNDNEGAWQEKGGRKKGGAKAGSAGGKGRGKRQ